MYAKNGKQFRKRKIMLKFEQKMSFTCSAFCYEMFYNLLYGFPYFLNCLSFKDRSKRVAFVEGAKGFFKVGLAF